MKKQRQYAIVAYTISCENLDNAGSWLLPEIYNSREEAVQGIEKLENISAYDENYNDSQQTLYGYMYGPLKTLQNRYKQLKND